MISLALHSLRIREIDNDGKLKSEVDLVMEMGFAVGMSIYRKKDKVLGTIKTMQGDTITIDVEDGPISGEATVSAQSFRKGEWKVNKKKPEPSLMAPCCSHNGLTSKEMKIGVTKGKIIEKLLELEKQHEDKLDKVIMQVKPQRLVRATEVIKKGKLTLVPCSYKIETRDELAAGSVALGVIDGQKYQLAPCIQVQQEGGLDESFLHPFWMVKTTNKADEANMKIVNMVKIDTKNDEFKIPIMQNIVDISLDETLKRYVAPKAESEVEPMVPAVKRRRIGKSA